MTPPSEADPLATLRSLDRTDNAALLDLCRACPLEADFTFYFARDPDFFAWPDAVFDDYHYQGVPSPEGLGAAFLIGKTRGWVGRGPGTFFYGGDARVRPALRGARLAERIIVRMSDTLPVEEGIGFGIVKKGNLPAEHTVRRGRYPQFRISELGTFRALNVVPFRRVGRPGRTQVRRARLDDLPDLAALMARCYANRLFAPVITADTLADDMARLADVGLGVDRYYVAEQGRQIVGVLGAWDMTPLKRSVILRYSLRARALRAAYRGLRLAFHGAAPLPDVGEAFRSLSLTRVAVADRDPAILRDLLAQVVDEHLGQGVHLIHLAFVDDDPLMRATRGLLAQRFESSLFLALHQDRALPPDVATRPDPYIDLALI